MEQKKTERFSFDVVVVGGGLSGVCAAIASARHGAKTVLIQNRSMLGGNASSEIRMHVAGANCHFGKKNFAETGILLELQLENKKRNPYHSFPVWDSVIWEKARYQEGLTLFLNTTLTGAEKNGSRISRICCYQMTTEKTLLIEGRIFIDATGNGTLGYFADAEWRMGSEDRAEFSEPDAPEHANDTTMGNSLMFIASDKGEEVKFEPPFWAHQFTEDDLRLRPHGKYTWYHGEDGITEEYVPESGYWWIELGGDTGDIISHGEEVSEELNKIVYGIWDHLKNAGDHGAKNYALEWVGSVAGIRESRRLVGDYLLTETDILENRVFDDAVAYGGWPMDEHAPHGVLDKDVNPTRFINFNGVYTIPYRSFYSKNIENLMMAGRDISVTKMALGSTRVMGTCAVGGQAAGTAAALAIRCGCTPRGVSAHIRELQQQLIRDDCWIPGFKNEDALDLARSARISATDYTEGCTPDKVINGVTRITDEGENCWQSQPMCGGSKTLSASLEEAKKLSELRLVFDSDLSRELMISMTSSVQARERKDMPPQLVKKYTVRAFNKERCVFERTVDENTKRLSVVPLNVIADRVDVEVHETYGLDAARIFELRLYGSPAVK